MNKLDKFAAACAAMCAVVLSVEAATIDVAIGESIADAVAQAQEGDVVQLAAGTYLITSGIVIDKGITVRGVHAALTTIKSDGSRFTPVTLNHADAVLERVTVRDGLHDSCGGVRISASGGTLQDAAVRKCTADKSRTNSGAVYLGSAAGVVRRCVIDECRGVWGGGMFIAASGIVDCCAITGCSAEWGGGIYINNGSLNPKIVHLTATGNTGSGNNIYNYSGASVKDVHNTWVGDVANGGFTGTHVIVGSATEEQLRNQGEPVEGMSEFDVDGLPYDAEHPSIGAHALVDDPVTVTWLGAATVGVGAEQTAAWSVEGAPEGATATAALYDPAGNFVGSGEGAFTYTATQELGYYMLVVTLDDGQGVVRDIVTREVVYAGIMLIHVSQTGSKTFPYDSAETGLTDIQTAIDSCLAGGTVVVHDGTYSIADTLKVEKGVTVKSANGREATILARNTSVNTRIFYLNHAEALVEGFTIQGGNAGGSAGGVPYGGGVLIGTAGGTLDRCIVENCSSGNCGGGMALLATNAVVRRTIFRGNSSFSAAYGGGVYITQGGGIVDNCLFYNNTGKWGGAVYADGTSPKIRIYNTTALDNQGDGGNICDYSAAHDTRAVNTISTFVGFTRDHCLGSTLFTDQPNSDYTLAPGATAIDAGVEYEGMCATDLVGNPRVSGETVDIGAYERSAENLDVDVSVDVKSADFTGEVVYTLTPTVAGSSSATLDWTILRSDGVVARTETGLPVGPLAFKPTEPGCYTVRVVASDGGRTAEVEHEDLFVAGTDRVFIDANGGNVYPFATAETASTNFHAAWSMVGSTAVVTVAEGTYDVRCCLDLTRNIRIVGAGSDRTVLRSSAAVNDRLVRINNPEASITGCALTGVKLGFPSSRNGAGVNFGPKGGLVEECVITNNVGNNTKGVGVNFEAGSKGILRRCTIGGNSGGYLGGGVYVPLDGGGVIDDCLILGNSASYGSGIYVTGATQMTNCTLIGDLYLEKNWVNARFVNCYISTRTIYDGADKETTFSHCASANISLTNGVGNIKVDPAFVDSEAKDYHLTRHSPLRKAGLATPQLRGLRDRDGNPRLSNGVVDIGCYQRNATKFVILIK